MGRGFLEEKRLGGKGVDENGEIEVEELLVDAAAQAAIHFFCRLRLLEYPLGRPSGISKERFYVVFIFPLLKGFLDTPDLFPVMGVLLMKNLLSQGRTGRKEENPEGSGKKSLFPKGALHQENVIPSRSKSW